MPNALTVSRPTKLSMSVAFLIALARYMVSDNSCIFVCTLNEYTKIKIAPITTGITIGKAIQAITATNIKPNGMSINVVIVAEVMKSRTVSKERKFDANEPTEFGLCSSRIPNTCSIMRAVSFMSTRVLAQSRK